MDAVSAPVETNVATDNVQAQEGKSFLGKVLSAFGTVVLIVVVVGIKIAARENPDVAIVILGGVFAVSITVWLVRKIARVVTAG